MSRGDPQMVFHRGAGDAGRLKLQETDSVLEILAFVASVAEDVATLGFFVFFLPDEVREFIRFCVCS